MKGQSLIHISASLGNKYLVEFFVGQGFDIYKMNDLFIEISMAKVLFIKL